MSTGIEGLTVANPWQPPEQLALQHCMTISQGHADALQDMQRWAIAGPICLPLHPPASRHPGGNATPCGTGALYKQKQPLAPANQALAAIK